MKQIERKHKFRKIYRTIRRIALTGVALSIFSLYALESTDKSVGLETATLLACIAGAAVSTSICTGIYLACKWKERDIENDIKRALKKWEK